MIWVRSQLAAEILSRCNLGKAWTTGGMTYKGAAAITIFRRKHGLMGQQTVLHKRTQGFRDSRRAVARNVLGSFATHSRILDMAQTWQCVTTGSMTYKGATTVTVTTFRHKHGPWIRKLCSTIGHTISRLQEGSKLPVSRRVLGSLAASSGHHDTAQSKQSVEVRRHNLQGCPPRSPPFAASMAPRLANRAPQVDTEFLDSRRAATRRALGSLAARSSDLERV
jgi:hypothetical protein